MQTHNILKPVLYATWLAGQYNDPVDIFYQLFADAQAVGRSVGIELPEQVNFDGAKTFAANSETGKHDKRQGFFAEVKQDKDGAIHPVITFHSFREGGKAAYWNPRDILFNQYRNNSDAPKYDPEKYKAKAAELAKKSEAARQAREVMEMAGYSLASQAAVMAFNAEQEATEHAYLTAKGIKAHGSKVATKTIKATLYSTREQEIKPDSYVCNQGELLIPIFSKAGVLVNLQRIKPDGTKLFLSGGKTSGCFYKLQGVDDGQALAAEGFATAASVCEATGKSVYFALSANNLKTICAENLDIGAVAADSGKAGIDAAHATGLPFLAPAGLKDGDDWNDYTSTCGIDATKQALAQLEVKERQQQHTYLNAAGDKERKKAFAIAQAAEVKPVDFGSIQVQEIEAVQDEEIRNAGTFAGILANTSLGKYAVQVADAIQMPRDTTVLTALGVVSAAVSMVYKVEYQYGGDLPASLYIATEQPASSGKSPILNRFTRPIQTCISALNAESIKFNAELEKDSEIAPKAYYKSFITDATPEALDQIIGGQFGHFSLASAEQAVVNTALGVSYSDGKKASNNDLILKGYSGDYHSSARITRNGYEGYVSGAVTVIAQRGTIETILERSDGTGIAERFIMLAEPTLLGYRDHLTPRAQPSMELKVSYSNAMESLVNLYGSTRDNGSVKYEDLTKLFLGAADWHKINLEKQALEPTMRDGGKYSHEMLRGTVGKFDQRVMKVAANLHVVETLMAKSGVEVPKQISSSHVDTAIHLTKLTIDCLFKSMIDKGIIGMSAEEEVVYSVVSKRGSNGILWSELYNSTKGLQPFKSYPSKGLAAKIKAIAVEMEKSGKLSSAESQQGGKTVIKIYVN